MWSSTVRKVAEDLIGLESGEVASASFRCLGISRTGTAILSQVTPQQVLLTLTNLDGLQGTTTKITELLNNGKGKRENVPTSALGVDLSLIAQSKSTCQRNVRPTYKVYTTTALHAATTHSRPNLHDLARATSRRSRASIRPRWDTHVSSASVTV